MHRFALSEFRQRFGLASGGGNPLQARSFTTIRSKDDVAVIAPRASATGRRIAERDGGAPSHGNLFQLAICKEGQPFPSGEKNGELALLVPAIGAACNCPSRRT